MDTAISPSSSYVSQSSIGDFASRAPRRASQYRLFPSVDPTPPASPVVPISLSRAAASSRRRSQSLDKKSISSPPRHTTRSRDARKDSQPELRPLRSARESTTSSRYSRDSNTVSSPSVRSQKPSWMIRASSDGDDNVHSRSNSVVDDSTYIPNPDDSHQQNADSPQRESQTPLPPPSANVFGRTANFGLSPVAENFQSRVRTRPRPNLRIAVLKEPQAGNRNDDTENEISTHDKPPAPPPKSPRFSAEDSAISRLSPHRPTAKSMSPESSSPMHQSGLHDVPKSSESHHMQTHLHPPSDPYARPSTSDGAMANASHGVTQRLAASATDLRLADPVKQPMRSPLRNFFRPSSRQKNRPTPEVSPYNLHDTSATTLRQLAPPDSGSFVSEQSYHSRDSSIVTKPTRRGSKDFDAGLKASSSTTPSEPLSAPMAALAAARANVAALMDSTVSAGSRSSGSDLSVRGRGLSDPLLRRPSTPSQSDPVETLSQLSEECDALHEKYATLRAERQKLSSALIAKLRDQKLSPEYLSSLLDDQLSLAAVSSSMDICFAKLKSLECQKEDAIAALAAAKRTPNQRYPGDNLAAMIASSMALSRKPSLAFSTGSGSRFTGRSTPDPSDSISMNRMTQQSTRTMSYGSSDYDFLENRLSSQSRSKTVSTDSIRRTDIMEKYAPETIPEAESPHPNRVSQSDLARYLDFSPRSVSPLQPQHDAAPVPESSHSESPGIGSDDKAAEEGIGEALNTRIDSPTLEDERDPRDRPQGNGSKAAKVLGLYSEPSSGKTSPRIRLPESSRSPSLSAPKRENNDDNASSLLSVDNFKSQPDQLASFDLPDLEAQLQSFPKPNANRDSTPGRRNTGGSFLTSGSSADSISEPELPPPPPRRREQRSQIEMKKRDPSAHTIKVYMEDDHMTEYYNHRMPYPQ